MYLLDNFITVYYCFLTIICLSELGMRKKGHLLLFQLACAKRQRLKINPIAMSQRAPMSLPG